MAPRPLLIFQKSSPSLSAASLDDVQSAGFGGGSGDDQRPQTRPHGASSLTFVTRFTIRALI